MPVRDKTTVIDRVLQMLIDAGPLGVTREDVWRWTHSSAAPSCVNALRKQGWDIHVRREKVKTMDDRIVHVSRYTLLGRKESE